MKYGPNMTADITLTADYFSTLKPTKPHLQRKTSQNVPSPRLNTNTGPDPTPLHTKTVIHQMSWTMERFQRLPK